MTIRKDTAKKYICLLLAALLLFSFIPMLSALKVSAEESNHTRVADPSTMDDWKRFFLSEIPSTENAGAIWTDKSVFTNTDDFGGLVSMQDEDNNFLVALSAIASSKSITGYSHVPTDTVFVLDVSRTMGENVRPGDNNNNAVSELVASVNKSIDRLLAENKHNRVGVVLYSGTYSPDVHADGESAMVLLPLGRYEQSEGVFLEKDNHIFKVGETLLTAESIRINSTVTSGGTPVEQKEREVYGGSFIQGGVYSAMIEFLGVTDTEISSEEFQSGTKRLPVMVLMSDGLATSAATNYMGDGDSIGTSDIGNGTTPEDELSTAIPFVTQLTCSYAKERIAEHYGREALFYTLGYKVQSTPVLDPANTTTDTHWDTYNVTHADEFMQLAVKSTWINNGWWGEGHWDTEYKAIEKSDYDLSKDYVDKYYHTDKDLDSMFDAITDEIAYKSLYYPTQVESGNTHLDGYVEFIDDIGEFMDIKKVHGILLGDTLFKGDNVAGNFIPGGDGGNLGSIDKPSKLGDELIRSVKARLGITETKVAQELVREAFMAGQLYCNPQTGEWSNFIGWYENTEGAYIGHGTRYDKTPLEGAKYYNESYGYLGKVIDGHNASDMMYISVRLRTEVETGKAQVIFRIPASLIPVIKYNVSLTGDSLRNPGEVTLNVNKTMGIDTDNDGVYDKDIPVSPIRLLYEVGLDSRINALNVSEIAGDGYKYTEDGNYDFYTSRWNKDLLDHEHPSMAENAVSFYEPSVENERYYYTENSTVYKKAGEEYVPYEGDNPADFLEPLYREFAVFEVINDNETDNGRVHLHYEQMSKEALSVAKQEGNTWYVPKGTVHRMYGTFHAGKGGFTDESKTQVNTNNTDTLMYSHYFDVESVPEDENSYYADVILGNNGRMSIRQAQGIKISTDSDITLQKCNDVFSFEVKALNTEITEPCTLTTIDKTGNITDREAVFKDGSFVVGLKAGENAYLTGLPAGTELLIAEVHDNNDHQVKSINGEDITQIILTVQENEVVFADFMNELASPVGCGAMVIQGTVKHPYAEDYSVPEDIKFIYDVAYTNTKGEEVAEQITLSAGEIYHISDIALGTVATVTEAKINPGFHCEYPTHSREIAVEKEENYIVFFNNTYTPEAVSPNVTVKGNKSLYGRADNQWLESDVFTFKLQKFSDNEWIDMTALDDDNNLKPVWAVVKKDKQTFDFTSVVKAEVYTEPGTYSYRVVEEFNENPKDGISYDNSVRWFDIFVTDKDMDGKLEIDKVVPYMGTTADFNEETLTWEVQTSFANTYQIMGSDEVKIEVNTCVVDNTQGAAEEGVLSLSGYKYALYQNDRLVAVLPATNEEGNTHITLSYGTFDIGKHIHYVLRPMEVQEPVSDMVYSDVEYHIVVDVADDTKGGVYAQITATSSEEGTEPVVGNEIAVEFVNTYGTYTPPSSEPSVNTEPTVTPTIPEASEDSTSSLEKPENDNNPDVPETGAGTVLDNIMWLLFIVVVIVGALGIFVVGKRK
ncbi:MAG: hypothetical protein IKJ83_02630 [Ruminococcus sp.]|nr:hypothetical protein [Ruminococcus sp.]